jgi:hypothetical protein
VPVSDAVHSAFAVAAPAGKKLGADANGQPAWVDAPLTVGQALAALDLMRQQKEAAGVWFKPMAATGALLFATDATSQPRINSAYTAAKDGLWADGTPWKAADGQFVAMTTADIIALGKKALGYIVDCAAYEAKLAAVVQSNPQTDITQGWPSNA